MRWPWGRERLEFFTVEELQSYLYVHSGIDQHSVFMDAFMEAILATIAGSTVVSVAVAKLIDTIGGQIGLHREANNIRRVGQANADVVVATAKAKVESDIIKAEGKIAIADLQSRAEERVRNQENQRQANIEAIAGKAAKELPEQVSDVPVEPDWTAQFFESCKDVSDEQMRTVWAKLLAGEVTKPGSFSLRTLACVKVLSKPDADLFTRFCSALWKTENGSVPLLYSPDNWLGVEFEDFMRLDSLNLISFSPGTTGYELQFNAIPALHWQYFGRQHILSHPDTRTLKLGVALLTEMGKELAVISGSVPDEPYRQSTVYKLRGLGWTVVDVQENTVEHSSTNIQ